MDQIAKAICITKRMIYTLQLTENEISGKKHNKLRRHKGACSKAKDSYTGHTSRQAQDNKWNKRVAQCRQRKNTGGEREEAV